jgi:hypothetical protein
MGKLPELAPGDYPPVPPLKNKSITRQRMAIIFNEWNRRYCENPDDFGDNFDLDGNPNKDYGECCADYFTEIADELDEKNLLPRP